MCQTSSELRESHIIPSCIFRLVRDKSLDNRFFQVSNRTQQVIQDGPKEYLLCDSCEQKIARYEKYFKEAIYFSQHGVKIGHTDEVVIVNNLDYKKTKLFFLSLLWRMSISSLPEFQIVCVQETEEKIRNMIRFENPGGNSEFSVRGIVPLINGKIQEGWTTTALMTEGPQEVVYHIIIGGIFYSLSTASQNSASLDILLLNDSSRWMIPLIDVRRIPVLWEHIKWQFNK